jgi:hypothetical protein
MGNRRLLGPGLLAVGATAAALAAVADVAFQRSAARFYQRTGPRSEPAQYGTAWAGFPVVYHRCEASQTLHSARLDAVRELLPTAELHPVRLPGGRAVVVVSALRWDEVTSTGVTGRTMLPYGEVMVGAMVTHRPAPPVLPLTGLVVPGVPYGAFVLHLPVTHRQARDGGRLAWGYPKFIADIEFEDSLETVSCMVSEGGQRVLHQTVHPAGKPTVMRESLVLYSSLDGELIAEHSPLYGIKRLRLGPGGGRLELGEHPVGLELRRLDIDPRPLATRRVVDLRTSLTFGHPVGSAREYVGYIGEDRDLGGYIVRYDGEEPIDMYAPFAPTAGSAAATQAGAESRT